MSSNKLRVSWRLFLLNILGCLLVGFGMLLSANQDEQLPLIAAFKLPAWPFSLVGLCFMGWFLIDLAKRIRAQAMHNRSHPDNGNKNGSI